MTRHRTGLNPSGEVKRVVVVFGTSVPHLWVKEECRYGNLSLVFRGSDPVSVEADPPFKEKGRGDSGPSNREESGETSLGRRKVAGRKGSPLTSGGPTETCPTVWPREVPDKVLSHCVTKGMSKT